MKKHLLLISAVVFIILAAVIFTGCESVTQSTKGKQVNIETDLYGFKVTAFDPATGSSSPTGMFGFGKIYYRSMPVEAGQPFYASHETYSIWGSKPASKSVIWIGRASEKSVLQFEAVPDTMIKISSDSIHSDSASLTVTPTAEEKSSKEADTSGI